MRRALQRYEVPDVAVTLRSFCISCKIRWFILGHLPSSTDANTDVKVAQAEKQHMLDTSEAFFRSPQSVKEKNKFDITKNIGWESGQQKRQSHNLPELKESLQLKWHDMEGRWPSDADVPGFEKTSKVDLGFRAC